MAILSKGQVVYKKTFGHQKGSSTPITSHTLFPIASASKPVTSIALALMGMNFDREYTLPTFKHKITLRQILSHTSGYPLMGDALIEKGMSRKQLLAHLKKQQPNCKPGKCYFYSNVVYSLVEEVLNIENASLALCVAQLKKALKTDEIHLATVPAGLPVAFPHSKGKTLPFPKAYPQAVPAAAGIFASLDGMIEVFKLQFGFRPDLIDPKKLAELHEINAICTDMHKFSRILPHPLNQLELTYGLGWRILKNKKQPGKDLIFHGGYINGIRSVIAYIPAEQVGIIILINEDTRFPLLTAMDFWQHMIRFQGS